MSRGIARFAVGSVLTLAASLPGAAAFAKEDAADMPKTTVDEASGISESVYANGLKLLVAPRADDPMAACMIWYTVGSRDEDVGETGLSHYLEHMLFKGSDKHPKGAIDKVTQMNGGSNNASTSYDRTEYHFTFPADRWAVALEIEADRMRGSNCQEKEFQAEKTVVLSELEMGLDDPADVLYEAAGSAAFRVSGYHAPVIGWPEDVRSTTRERMMRYYLKHYTPDRATIVIVGGVDRDAVIAKTTELFSKIPAGTTVRHELAEPPPLGETRLTLRQATQVPRLLLTYRSVSIRDPREPLLDLVSAILSGDKSTRLEKGLVDTGIAASAECWSDTRRDDGLFQVQVEPTEGHSLEECEAAVKAVLSGLSAEGPTAAELALAKKKTIAGVVFSTESADGLGRRLGSLAAVTDWRYHLSYAKAIEAATPESVRAILSDVAGERQRAQAEKRDVDAEAVRALFDPVFAVVARSLPKPLAPGAAGGGAGSGGGGRSGHRTSPEEKGAFGARWRSEGDASGAAIERALDLKPARAVLANGLTILALKSSLAPVFVAQLSFRDGRLLEAAPGLDAMTTALLDEGTTSRSGEEIALAIGGVGGTLGVSSSGVSAKTLSADASLALSLVREVAATPAFPEDAVERVRAQQTYEILVELDTPRAVAVAVLNEAIYGAGHPLGRSSKGTKESVKGIAREQVLAHHAKVYVPKNAVLTIVSDRPPEEAIALATKAFESWAGGAAPTVALPEIPAPKAATIHKDLRKEQTNLYLGHVGIRRSDPDFVALEVLENVLGTGAGFTDRLSKNIRDDKGLAYTVSGNITSNSDVLPGTFRVFSNPNPENAPTALAEMRQEVQGILDRPPTPDELQGAKAALRGGMISRCQSASALAAMLQLLERHQLGFDYPKRYLAEVEKVTAEDVVRVAKAHIHPGALIEVVVGPAMR